MKFSVNDKYLTYDGEGDIIITNRKDYCIYADIENIRKETNKEMHISNFVFYNVNGLPFKTKIKLIFTIIKMFHVKH